MEYDFEVVVDNPRVAALDLALVYHQHYSPHAAPGDDAVIKTAEKFLAFVRGDDKVQP